MDILEKEKQLAEERSLNPSFKDNGPESEEISYTKTETEKKPRKKKPDVEGVTDFDTFERFSPRASKTPTEPEGGEE